MEHSIIKKIIEDATRDNAARLEQAREDAKERIENAKEEITENTEQMLEKAKNKQAQLQSQQEMADKTQQRKEDLMARGKVIDGVFADVKAKLIGMSAKDTQTLVAALIKNYAKDGDTVTISKNDDKTITETFVKGLPVKNLKRVVSEKFDGGIVLENESYVRSLTLDELFERLRANIELDVSRMLF